MEERIKIPEKERKDRERANLSDAELKTLVVRMLTEMIGYGCKIEEQVKAVQYREPTVMRKKLGLKSTAWDRRKK